MRAKIKLRARVKEAEPVTITTEFIKLDSFLKYVNAVESGGMAKEVILEGLVRVNGEVCTHRGKKLYPGDRVSFDGGIYQVTAE